LQEDHSANCKQLGVLAAKKTIASYNWSFHLIQHPNESPRSFYSGGGRGFHKVIWTVKEYVCAGDSPYITLHYRSFDGEQGFPGNLDVHAGADLHWGELGQPPQLNLGLHRYLPLL
jgi:galactose mutarotase-like enzyme